MRKIILLFAVTCMAIGGVWAQGHAFVDSEKVFKSQADYNTAIQQLETLAETYQKNIDDAYKTLDQTYENYESQRSYLSEQRRAESENQIITMEKKITTYQEEKFGSEGELMKKRLELIKPIQERIFAAINSYAQQNSYTMILDVANNQSLLYYSPALDKTQDVINMLNK